jgi:hypothetical protein
MMRKFGAHINFLTVYILEAHADDTWPIGSDVVYKQTHTTEERSCVARDFIQYVIFDKCFVLFPVLNF